MDCLCSLMYTQGLEQCLVLVGIYLQGKFTEVEFLGQMVVLIPISTNYISLLVFPYQNTIDWVS